MITWGERSFAAHKYGLSIILLTLFLLLTLTTHSTVVEFDKDQKHQQQRQQLHHELHQMQIERSRNLITTEVVGFWNIFAEGPYYRNIINEQYRVLQTSGVLDHLTKLYYVTMGTDGWDVRFDSEKAHLLKYFRVGGSEIKTLHYLHTYCRQKPQSKVLYFHNKGSLNYDVLNINFRRALDCFVLNPSCIEALDQFDTCGWRISPLPHIHYSGNYWWARCSHINALIPPLASVHNKTFLSLTASLYRPGTKWGQPTATNPFPDQPYLGLGRYFAETWVGSRPMFLPADCMNASVNNRYMWGKFPLPWRMVNKRCPNYRKDFMNYSLVESPNDVNAVLASSSSSSISGSSSDRSISSDKSSGSSGDSVGKSNDRYFKHLHYGLDKCRLAGMILQPELMQKRFRLSIKNLTAELYDRSLYWYGQQPELHVQWLSLYK